jgi:hypothetical protein
MVWIIIIDFHVQMYPLEYIYFFWCACQILNTKWLVEMFPLLDGMSIVLKIHQRQEQVYTSYR